MSFLSLRKKPSVFPIFLATVVTVSLCGVLLLPLFRDVYKDISPVVAEYYRNWKYLEDFKKSQQFWEEFKKEHQNSYQFQRRFSSWTGWHATETTHVRQGRITYRSFKSYESNGKEETFWEEFSYQIGSNSARIKPTTVDEVYKSCNEVLASFLKSKNYVTFKIGENNVIKACGYTPRMCADDCFRGDIISEVKPLTE